MKNNAILDTKPPCSLNTKEAEGKCNTKLVDSCIPPMPKWVGWTNKHRVVCKKQTGLHNSHNYHYCHRFNKDDTPSKKNGGIGKSHSQKKSSEGAYFTQIVWMDLRTYSASQPRSCTNTRSEALTNSTAMTNLTTILEDTGWIAWGISNVSGT